ncbi:hypothetical protein [Nonomuraea dietziae]
MELFGQALPDDRVRAHLRAAIEGRPPLTSRSRRRSTRPPASSPWPELR